MPRDIGVTGHSDTSHALANVFVEELERSAPRKFRCRLIVPWRRVIMKSVLSTGIEIALILHVRRLERFLERRPARVDARIIFSRLNHQGRLDLRHILDIWR